MNVFLCSDDTFGLFAVPSLEFFHFFMAATQWREMEAWWSFSGLEVVRAEQQFEVKLQSRCNRCLQQSRFSAAYLLISGGDFASLSQNRATVKPVVQQIVRCASLHLTVPLDYNTWACVWLKLPCSTHASTCVCHAARWNDLQGNGAFSPLFTAAPLSGSLPKPTLGRRESWPVCGTWNFQKAEHRLF